MILISPVISTSWPSVLLKPKLARPLAKLAGLAPNGWCHSYSWPIEVVEIQRVVYPPVFVGVMTAGVRVAK